MKSKTITIRLNEKTKEKLESLNINVSEFIREAVEAQLKEKVCPTCQRVLRSK
jgi:predicted DNA-binding protein